MKNSSEVLFVKWKFLNVIDVMNDLEALEAANAVNVVMDETPHARSREASCLLVVKG